MKAIRSNGAQGLDGLSVVDIPDPGAPGYGEIRVRVRASSLNYHDLGVVTGRIRSDVGRIPMADGSGIVEAVGEGVGEFTVGDHVVSTFFPQWLDGEPTTDNFAGTPGDGIDGYAREIVVAPATAFTRAPKGYSHAEAATLTTAGLTAWRALIVNGALKAGDSVLVMGTGGVSIFALQIAKAMGASVLISSSSDEKLRRAMELGADHGFNYSHVKKWGRRVREITHDRGVDHVVEVGGVGTLAQSIEAARVGGHSALIGVLTGVVGSVPTGALMARQQRLQGLVVGSRQHQLDMIRAIDATNIKPVIDRSFPLDGLGDAFRLQQAGGHFGKIVIEF